MFQFSQNGFQVFHAIFCVLFESEELLVNFGILLHQTGIVGSVWFNLGGGKGGGMGNQRCLGLRGFIKAERPTK